MDDFINLFQKMNSVFPGAEKTDADSPFFLSSLRNNGGLSPCLAAAAGHAATAAGSKWRPKIIAFGLGILLITALLFGGGCGQQPAQPGDDPNRIRSVTFEDYTLPVFETADKQLNYAKSLFPRHQEQATALRYVIQRFPDNRAKIGEAKLEMAYLHLGSDFRLAPRSACLQALEAYKSVIQQFSDIPPVSAKAVWYMGWIHTDLLQDKAKGLALYHALAENYPDSRFSRIRPVPWLELIFPNPIKKPYSADDKHQHSWAGLALLEIIKHTEDEAQRRAAFDKIRQKHPASLTTGYALREILQRASHVGDLAAIVKNYVDQNTVNPELNRDLTSLAAGKTKS